MSKSIRCYDYVNQPFAQVCEALRSQPNAIFRDATTSAKSRVEALAAELHVNIGGIDVGKSVAIHIDGFSEQSDHTGPKLTVHLDWKASGAPVLFPVMAGKLHAYPITKTETQLDFEGEYEPPLGLLGKALDAVVGHRIAEASVHQFLAEVAAYIRKHAPTLQNQIDN